MAITSAADINQNTLVGQYVYAYMQTQQYRFDPLDLKAAQLQNKQTFFTQLNGRLNTLLSAMDRFGSYKNVTTTKDDGTEEINRQFVRLSTVDSSFVTRRVTASQSDFVTATARGSALTGTNSVRVLQLATSDTYIGRQVGIEQKDSGEVDEDGKPIMKGSLSANLLNAINPETEKGTVSFTVKVGNAEQIFNVEYTKEDSNEDLMKRIVQTVNSPRNDGGFGDMVNAAFVKDTTGTARLTFTSRATGEENRLQFSASNGAANIFGIADSPTVKEDEDKAVNEAEDIVNADANANTAAILRKIYNENDADSYGYQRADASSLNARINLNGVTVIRGANSITDAIDGVTLTLRKAHTESDIATNLTTEVDTKAVENLIQPLVDAFNGLANFVAVNRQAHGSDSAMIGLQNALRNMASDDLSSYADKNHVYTDPESKPLKYLAELGFRISTDNVLSLSDTARFESILKSPDGPKLISDIITGFSAKVSEHVDRLSGRDSTDRGIINSRLSSIAQQITDNNKRIEQVDQRILKEAEAIRKQYTAYLSAFYNAQNQSAFLSLFSAGDSLLQQQANMNNNNNNNK